MYLDDVITFTQTSMNLLKLSWSRVWNVVQGWTVLSVWEMKLPTFIGQMFWLPGLSGKAGRVSDFAFHQRTVVADNSDRAEVITWSVQRLWSICSIFCMPCVTAQAHFKNSANFETVDNDVLEACRTLTEKVTNLSILALPSSEPPYTLFIDPCKRQVVCVLIRTYVDISKQLSGHCSRALSDTERRYGGTYQICFAIVP